MHKRCRFVLGCITLAVGAFFPPFGAAETLWSDASLSVLSGNNYRIGDSERTIVTFEHASGHTWGDTFFFVDRIQPKYSDDYFYGEFSPRLQLKRFHADNQQAFVKALFLASTWEFGEGFNHYLYGPGIDLVVPKFQFFQLNLYRRNNDTVDDGWQLTTAWGLPFTLAGSHWLYSGFIDWAGGSDDQHANANFTSQLKWNVGRFFSQQAKCYLGIEYVYWRNKFGIQHAEHNKTHETNMNLLVKLHF